MKKESASALITITVLSILWNFFNRGQDRLSFYVVDLPYFLVFTGLIFSIGIPSISQGIRYGTKASLINTIIFPFALLILYFTYLAIHGQPVMQGASLLLPYLVLFPVMAFYHRVHSSKYVSWWDLFVLILFLWPVTLVDLPEKSGLPIDGVSFDSIYRMMIILVAVYAFVVVRRLVGVGFSVDASWRKLWTTIWVWALYIGLVIVLGLNMGFIQYEGFWNNDRGHWDDIVIRFLSIFLHTALFEELFFRGLLQNMLANKVRQSSSPMVFWILASILMILLSLMTGLLMHDTLFWFPMVIAIILFVVAYLLAIMFKGFQHHYLAMAITSVLFGLVHFHAGSVEFVGFAIIAGWAYGYVYWKTRNVFYAALIHTLVNISPLLIGLDVLK